jgi:arsenate reductase
MPSKAIKIFHNPNCGTSRNALALLRERGIEPEVIEYLKTPPTRKELAAIVKRSGLSARDFLRTREKLYGELDLANPKWTDDQIVGFLAANPALLNRPVVETPKGVKPCRPAEAVLNLLD